MQIDRRDIEFISELYQRKGVISVEMTPGVGKTHVTLVVGPTRKFVEFITNPSTGRLFKVTSTHHPKSRIDEIDETAGSPFIGRRVNDKSISSLFHDSMMNNIIEQLMEECGIVDDEDDEDEHCRECKESHDCPAYHHYLKEKEQEKRSKKPNNALSFDNIKEMFGDAKTDGSTTNGIDDSELEDAYEDFTEFIKGLNESLKEETEEPKKEEVKPEKKDDVMDIFIVTNTTGTGSYTPSVFTNFEEAREFLMECTAKNVISAVDDKTMKYSFEVPVMFDKGSRKTVEVSFENNDENYTILKCYNKVAEFLRYVENNISEVGLSVSPTYCSSMVVYQDDMFNMMNLYKITINGDDVSIHKYNNF